MNASLPKIVLLGRPNVGKSTLFNRLIRSNRAITHDQPGITRDRLEGVVRKHKQPLFTIVDTGGLNLTTSSLVDTGPKGIRGFEQAIFDQTQQALAHAQAIVLVVDAKAGLLAQDKELADLARRFNLPIICAVNKVDGLELTDNLCADFHALGLPLLAISAAHGLNIPNLISQISDLVKFEIDLQPNEESLGETKAPLRLALLGRPNAGKSSLVNAWVEEDRMIISEQAGTTRDSVDVYAAINGQEYIFVDTAGVRRKTKITDSVERFSVNSALKTTSKADVTLLVLDAKVGLENQDKRLIDLLATRKTPFLILANKIDLLSDQAINNLRKELDTALAFCSYVPVLMVSAKSHKGLKKVLSLAAEV
ncbi:MAG: ribosome biogenesis GTPase Der, partial [Desulfovibrionaceae bacterium]|nr:ribosome biogenesis GTPase Der [Desulfovibrionaceae bacterium]